MISRAYITEWRDKMPWKLDSQVEQDLILSRLLVELFSDNLLSEKLLLRGGTGLYKLYYKEPVRYSEDIDFVQKEAAPIGEILKTIRKVCNPILGEPRWKQTKGRDLFDLWYGIKDGKVDTDNIVMAFKKYIKKQGLTVTKKDFSDNLEKKIKNPEFRKDTEILLSSRINYLPDVGYKIVSNRLVELL